MANDDLPVGIDLGTTNSLVGAVVGGHPRIFPDASGAELLPSVVGGSPEGAVLVGRAARNRRLLDPAGTVVSIKRRMGTDALFDVGGRRLSPPQISALILGALLDRAEAALGARPRRAVITVPAYFGDAQRQATRDAGELAGLTVERLVNEPTAAALTYRTGGEELVMVYDLGGGTFDVSVLERAEALLEVRSSRGDTHLGGDDIDQALTARVLGRLGAARGRVEADPRAMTRLYEAVERAKIALSDREEVRLFDPFLTGEGAEAVHLDLPLARADVDEVARPLVERTLACIDAAMRDAGIRGRDPSRVVLVGGASRMPIVAAMVAAHLGRPVQVDPDAERAVALGASLLAGRIGGAEVDEVLVDITPHTLAAGAFDSLDAAFAGTDEEMAAVPVIPRDTVVPVERSRTVYTIVEDQQAVEIPVVQGEHRLMARDTRLGTVHVGPLPPGPANAPVEVTFRLDLSGVLHVRAQHLISGKSAGVEITDSPYRLTAQRRRSARAEVEALRARAEDGDGGPSEADLALCGAMLARAQRALERGEAADLAAKVRVREAMEVLAAAVEERAPETMDRCDQLSEAILDLV